jgi:endonuclease III
MNDDTIQDLKQFIATTISQQTSDLATKEDIEQLDNKLSSKIDNLSSSVAKAIEQTNEVQESQINDQESRIAKLEQKAA